jgi:molybdopterin-guanine dinucleotide biosynthesis protein A
MHQKNISGIILSGGKSSRMGSDKGLIRYNGQLLIELSLQRIKSYCNEVLISANNDEYKILGYPVIHDKIKNIGPIGGISSSIRKAKNEKVIITACDIPEMDSEIIHSLVNLGSQADIVFLALPSGKIQSLPLVLSKKSFGIIESQIQRKQYALHELIAECVNFEDIKSQKITIQKEPKNVNSLMDLNHD